MLERAKNSERLTYGTKLNKLTVNGRIRAYFFTIGALSALAAIVLIVAPATGGRIFPILGEEIVVAWIAAAILVSVAVSSAIAAIGAPNSIAAALTGRIAGQAGVLLAIAVGAVQQRIDLPTAGWIAFALLFVDLAIAIRIRVIIGRLPQ